MQLRRQKYNLHNKYYLIKKKKYEKRYKTTVNKNIFFHSR